MRQVAPLRVESGLIGTPATLVRRLRAITVRRGSLQIPRTC